MTKEATAEENIWATSVFPPQEIKKKHSRLIRLSMTPFIWQHVTAPWRVCTAGQAHISRHRLAELQSREVQVEQTAPTCEQRHYLNRWLCTTVTHLYSQTSKQIPHNRLQVNAAMWCIGLFVFKAWWRKWLNWSVTIFSRSQVYVIIWCKPTQLPPFCFSLCWIKLFSSGWFPQFRLILTSWQYFPHQQVTEWAPVCTIVSSLFNTGLFLALYDQHDPFFQFRKLYYWIDTQNDHVKLLYNVTNNVEDRNTPPLKPQL